MILVVDDVRTFAFPATYARTSAAALEALDGRPYDQLWLDWDLGGEDTVKPVAARLEALGWDGEPYPVGCIALHTSNPVGRRWMLSALSPFYTVVHVAADRYTVVTPQG